MCTCIYIYIYIYIYSCTCVHLDYLWELLSICPAMKRPNEQPGKCDGGDSSGCHLWLGNQGCCRNMTHHIVIRILLDRQHIAKRCVCVWKWGISWNSHVCSEHDENLLLVGGLEHVLFFHIWGMPSSQLTVIFFRRVGIPPTRLEWGGFP